VNKRTKFLLGIGVIAALVLSLQIAAFAGHDEVSLPGSNFEIDTDANLKVDDTAPPSLDWANVTQINKADTASGQQDESFGNGTKEDTAVPSVVDGGIPPSKADLKFFGVYQEGSTDTGFLNMYWSRVQDPTGTTNMDFEFNKNKCKVVNGTPTADSVCSTNGVTPVRSAGDSLIQYDLANGGVNPELFLSKWVTTGNKSQCEAANSLPCWSTKQNLTASGDATGSINTTPIAAVDADGLGAHSARTFGEAQVKLSALIPAGSCIGIGSAYLKSRSSDSFTAALKDFVPPESVDITNCGKVIIRKQTEPPQNPTTGPQFGYTKTFTTTPATANTFQLRDDGVQTFTNVTLGPDLKVTEDVLPSTWALKGVDCNVAGHPSVGVSPTITGAEVKFTLDQPTDVLDCTYTNEQRTTTINTVQSFYPNDTAAISGNPNSGFTGTVSFRLFSGLTCGADADALYTDTDNAVSASAPFTASTTNGVPADAQQDYAINAANLGTGNFSWKVNYVPGTTDTVHPPFEYCHEDSTVTIDDNDQN